MSRRKPALRIGGGVMNRNSLYQKDNDAKPGGLGLLGAYQDSDSEDNTDSASNQLTKAINNLDTKVADFLKEIDKIEAADGKKEETKNEPIEISYGNWQQCIDENTQHPYYWNTATNEVTWVLPEEISRQLEQVKNSTDSKPSLEDVTNNANETIIKTDEKSEENDPKEDAGKQSKTVKINEDSFDIDVDAELDQALENTESKEPVRSFAPPTQLDLELEVLRRGDLPLSDGEEEDLLIRFESDLLKLEEGEEEKRKSGDWKTYEEEIEKRKQEINLDKTKWREERLPELKRMRIDGVSDTKEKQKNEIFQSDIGNFEKKEENVEVKDNADGEKGDQTTEKSQDKSPENVELKEPTIPELQSDSPSSSLEDQMFLLSSIIIEKLAYIGVSQRDFTSFHRILIEIETRVTDCKEGLLPASYVLTKLQAATQQLKAYEDNATPEGWSCHWDRTGKRYFYMNNETKKMQWQYPEVKKKEIKSEDKETETSSSESNQKKRASGESVQESEDATKSKKMRSVNDENNPKNASETYVQQNYKTFASYQQMMHASTPPPPGEGVQPAPPPLPSAPAEVPPPPPPAEEDVEDDVDTNVEDDGIMMEMSEDEVEENKSDAVNTAIISQPILYKSSDMAQFQAPMMNYAMYASASTAYQEASSAMMQSVSQGVAVSTNANTAKQTAKIKVKKTKKSKKSAPVKKPAKGMTSLVAQWQKAKNQIEEEDRMLEQDDENEVDHKTLAKQQIEKWKTDQIESGKALTNSNFEPVPEDWRSRILKKKKAKG